MCLLQQQCGSVTTAICACYNSNMGLLQQQYVPVTTAIWVCYNSNMCLLQQQYGPVKTAIWACYNSNMCLLQLQYMPVTTAVCACHNINMCLLQQQYVPVTTAICTSHNINVPVTTAICACHNINMCLLQQQYVPVTTAMYWFTSYLLRLTVTACSAVSWQPSAARTNSMDSRLGCNRLARSLCPSRQAAAHLPSYSQRLSSSVPLYTHTHPQTHRCCTPTAHLSEHAGHTPSSNIQVCLDRSFARLASILGCGAVQEGPRWNPLIFAHKTDMNIRNAGKN